MYRTPPETIMYSCYHLRTQDKRDSGARGRRPLGRGKSSRGGGEKTKTHKPKQLIMVIRKMERKRKILFILLGQENKKAYQASKILQHPPETLSS